MPDRVIPPPSALELPNGILFLPCSAFQSDLLRTEGSSRLPTRWTRARQPDAAPAGDWIYGLPVWPERGQVALEIRWGGENRLSALDRLVRVVSRAHVGKPAPYTVRSVALEHIYTPERIDLILQWGKEQDVGIILRFP